MHGASTCYAHPWRQGLVDGPRTRAPLTWAVGHHTLEGARAREKWWEVFGDSELNALVERALRGEDVAQRELEQFLAAAQTTAAGLVQVRPVGQPADTVAAPPPSGESPRESQ